MYTKIGPWGGEGGSTWDDEHIGGIRQIVIQHGRAIDSIQIGYDVQGALVWGDNHGGRGGSRTVINLKYPEELLVGVSGSWGDLQNITGVIRSLTFQTNKRTFGPYGEQQGVPFSYSAVGGKIVGFYGRIWFDVPKNHLGERRYAEGRRKNQVYFYPLELTVSISPDLCPQHGFLSPTQFILVDPKSSTCSGPVCYNYFRLDKVGPVQVRFG